MIKKIAWEAFKNTGDINTYLELKQIENLEDKIEKKDIGIRKEGFKQKNLENLAERNIESKTIERKKELQKIVRGIINMATINVKGIVLAENNMGDYDKMLTILTPNLGKISCSAKGARRPKSALLAGTQLFCFCEYLIY